MSLVWKLLRRHVSVPQFAGFFFANLLGMLIVLLSVQFYYDVLPVFTQGDSFIKKDCRNDGGKTRFFNEKNRRS